MAAGRMGRPERGGSYATMTYAGRIDWHLRECPQIPKGNDMGSRVGKCMPFLVVFVALFVWGAATALSQTLSLDDQAAGEIGDSVAFTLSIDYPAGESGEIQAVTVNVGFDEMVLTYDGHTRGSLVENWPAFDVSSPQEGQLRVAGLTYASGDGLQPGDSGAIVQLRFFVNTMEDATLTISALDDLATFGTRNGQFTFEPHICQHNGDVNQDGSVTAADALLAFQQALGLTQLSACQVSIADVYPQPSAPDDTITASDALCIFQKSLGLPSCLDILPPPNEPPVADAGSEQFVEENTLVTLSGSGSDPDGTIVGYRWVQTSGMTVVLSGADTPNASFTAPEVAFEVLFELLVFQLTVTDDDGASATATVLISVADSALTNESPTADAGLDQRVSENSQVTLSGSGTDLDGMVTDYYWLQTSGTHVLLFGADTRNPSFIAPDVDANEDLVFELTVVDDEFGFATDTVTITVLDTGSHTPLTANAGPDQTVDENTLVTLSGADSEGRITEYQWIQTSGASVLLFDAHTATPSFTAPEVDSDEDLVFQLTVIEKALVWDTDTVTITVRAAPASSGLREMVFQNPGPGQPTYVIAGDNAGLQYWTTPSGTVSQGLYEKADGTERVRIFYDEESGVSRTVHNEVSGHWLSIREAGPDRTDFWAYDNTGSYLGGFAVFEGTDGYYYGDIVGVPAHEGREITGELNPDTASWTGSFTLMGDVEDGLANVQSLPPELTTLVDGLVPGGTIANAKDAANHGPVLAADFDLHTGFSIAGMVLLAAGTPVLVAGGGTALIVAGAATFLAAQVLPEIADGIRTKFGGSCPPDSFFGRTCKELTNLAGDFLASRDTRSLGDTLRDAQAWLKEKPSRLREKVNSGRKYLETVAGRLSPGDLVRSKRDDEPASLIAPPTVGGNLFGQAQGPSGASVSLGGTVDSTGRFRVAGTSGQGRRVSIRGSLDDDGTNAGGTFEWGDEQGEIPREFPPGTPYLLCNYAYLKSSSGSFGTTREFLGWSIVNGYPSGTVRSTYFDGSVETRTSSASCDVCTAEGTVSTLAAGTRVETISCSQYQMAKNAYWSRGIWHHPVPTAKFSCAETTIRCY